MADMNEHYVYGLIDPDTQLPFYIGKGKGNRAQSHLKLEKADTYNPRKRNHIEKLLNDGKHVEIVFYSMDLSDKEAADEEERIVRKYGRKHIDKDGILLNLAPGGYGGDTSAFFTESSLKKISERMSGIRNPQSKLSKEQVIEIYNSPLSKKELSILYNISCTQIGGIKRKVYYKSITENISDLPGYCKTDKKPRISIPVEVVKEIFLKEETYEYFKEKFMVSRVVVKNIKSGKSYKNETADLGPAGHVKKYKLSNDDIAEILSSDLPTKKLAEKFNVHRQTIVNIKTYKTRKFISDPF